MITSKPVDNSAVVPLQQCCLLGPPLPMPAGKRQTKAPLFRGNELATLGINFFLPRKGKELQMLQRAKPAVYTAPEHLNKPIQSTFQVKHAKRHVLGQNYTPSDEILQRLLVIREASESRPTLWAKLITQHFDWMTMQECQVAFNTIEDLDMETLPHNLRSLIETRCKLLESRMKQLVVDNIATVGRGRSDIKHGYLMKQQLAALQPAVHAGLVRDEYLVSLINACATECQKLSMPQNPLRHGASTLNNTVGASYSHAGQQQSAHAQSDADWPSDKPAQSTHGTDNNGQNLRLGQTTMSLNRETFRFIWLAQFDTTTANRATASEPHFQAGLVVPQQAQLELSPQLTAGQHIQQQQQQDDSTHGWDRMEDIQRAVVQKTQLIQPDSSQDLASSQKSNSRVAQLPAAHVHTRLTGIAEQQPRISSHSQLDVDSQNVSEDLQLHDKAPMNNINSRAQPSSELYGADSCSQPLPKPHDTVLRSQEVAEHPNTTSRSQPDLNCLAYTDDDQVKVDQQGSHEASVIRKKFRLSSEQADELFNLQKRLWPLMIKDDWHTGQHVAETCQILSRLEDLATTGKWPQRRVLQLLCDHASVLAKCITSLQDSTQQHSMFMALTSLIEAVMTQQLPLLSHKLSAPDCVKLLDQASKLHPSYQPAFRSSPADCDRLTRFLGPDSTFEKCIMSVIESGTRELGEGAKETFLLNLTVHDILKFFQAVARCRWRPEPAVMNHMVSLCLPSKRAADVSQQTGQPAKPITIKRRQPDAMHHASAAAQQQQQQFSNYAGPTTLKQAPFWVNANLLSALADCGFVPSKPWLSAWYDATQAGLQSMAMKLKGSTKTSQQVKSWLSELSWISTALVKLKLLHHKPASRFWQSSFLQATQMCMAAVSARSPHSHSNPSNSRHQLALSQPSSSIRTAEEHQNCKEMAGCLAKIIQAAAYLTNVDAIIIYQTVDDNTPDNGRYLAATAGYKHGLLSTKSVTNMMASSIAENRAPGSVQHTQSQMSTPSLSNKQKKLPLQFSNEWKATAETAILSLMCNMPMEDVATTLETLVCGLGVRPNLNFWTALITRLTTSQLSTMPTSAITSICKTMALIRYRPPDAWLHALQSATLPRLATDFSQRELANLFLSLCTIRATLDQHWMFNWFQATKSSLHQWSPSLLVQVMCAFAKHNVKAPSSWLAAAQNSLSNIWFGTRQQQQPTETASISHNHTTMRLHHTVRTSVPQVAALLWALSKLKWPMSSFLWQQVYTKVLAPKLGKSNTSLTWSRTCSLLYSLSLQQPSPEQLSALLQHAANFLSPDHTQSGISKTEVDDKDSNSKLQHDELGSDDRDVAASQTYEDKSTGLAIVLLAVVRGNFPTPPEWISTWLQYLTPSLSSCSEETLRMAIQALLEGFSGMNSATDLKQLDKDLVTKLVSDVLTNPVAAVAWRSKTGPGSMSSAAPTESNQATSNIQRLLPQTFTNQSHQKGIKLTLQPRPVLPIAFSNKRSQHPTVLSFAAKLGLKRRRRKYLMMRAKRRRMRFILLQLMNVLQLHGYSCAQLS